MPQSMPKVIQPKPLKMEGRDVLAGPKMTEYLTAVNKMAQFEWTLSMVDLGHIPHGTL